MKPQLADTLRLKLDDWRVSQHFKRVENRLRAADVSHLPSTLQQTRGQHLDQLHFYATRAIFPRNYERPGYSPCFIDRDGRECAVAHLVMRSGSGEIAHNIAVDSNYAYVRQMISPELDQWAANSGLSKEELALIQPGYYLNLTGEFMWLVMATWAAGFLALFINAIQISRKRDGFVIPIISVIIGTFLALVGTICLLNAITAYQLGTHPDGYPGDLPLRDVAPLILGGLISLCLALLIIGVSFYRTRHYLGVGDLDTPS